MNMKAKSSILLFALMLVVYTPLLAHNPDCQVKDNIPFIENKNQWHDRVLFQAEMGAARLFLEKNKFTYLLIDPDGLEEIHHLRHEGTNKERDEFKLGMHAFEMYFKGANKEVQITPSCEEDYYFNYFLGNDSSKWASNVLSYHEVRYDNLYNDIDLKMYSSAGNLKYDFILHPNANPKQIELFYDEVGELSLKDGNLYIETTVNTLVENRPYAYQYINGKEVQVNCQFQLRDGIVSFVFPEGYDTSKEVIIDPEIVFSTYTGSTVDNWGFTATFDNSGHLYAGGIAMGFGYPTRGAFQNAFGGGYMGRYELPNDISISKLSPNGDDLIYSTYLGGSANETPHSLIVNSKDELIVLGNTGSRDFPTSSNAYDKTFNGGNALTAENISLQFDNGTDIVLTHFTANGRNIIGSTYIGGNRNDGHNTSAKLRYNYGDESRGEVMVDAADNIYMVSTTYSTDFPTTSNANQQSRGGGQDGCLAKFNSDLSQLLYASYIGGGNDDACYGIKLDQTGNVFVTGGTRSSDFPNSPSGATSFSGDVDGFVARFDQASLNMTNFRYVGTNRYDQSYSIETDADDFIYIYGQTAGSMPIQGSVYSNSNSGQFIQKLSNDLQNIEFATIFGRGDGDPDISPTAFLVDICNRIYISGWGGRTNASFNDSFLSSTSDLPITNDAYQSSTNGSDFYFMVLEENAAALEYASFFGGRGENDEHVDGGTSRFDKTGIVYQAVCAGCRLANGFPTTSGALSQTNGSDNCNLGAIKFDFQVPGVFAGIGAAPSVSGCAPLSVDFTNSSDNATDFLWDFDDNGATSTQFEPTYVFTNTGIYDVMMIASNPSACNQSDTTFLEIQILDPNSVEATYTTEVDCAAYKVTFTSNSFDTEKYTWDFGDGNTAEGGIVEHVYPGPGDYTVQLTVESTIPNCPASDRSTNTITIKDAVIAAGSVNPNETCINEDFQFTAGGINTTSYQWSFPDGTNSTDNVITKSFPTAGEYLVTLTAFNPESCNLEDTMVHTIYAFDTTLTATFDFVLPEVCDEPSVQFTSNLSDRLDFSWNFGDGSGLSTEYNPNHLFPASGSYLVRLIVDSPCAKPDTIERTITVEEPPIVDGEILTVSEDGCAPLSVEFEGAGNATNYLWIFGDGDTGTGTATRHLYEQAGVYNVQFIASDPNTCNLADTTTVTVEAYLVAIADFEVSTLISEVGRPVELTNNSQNADSYVWDFGNGQSSTEENPALSYNQAGDYKLCLSAENARACNDSICKNMEILPEIHLGVPNAFTPNDDGLNDMLYIEGREGIASLEFKVFNRWGELVFESNDPQVGWDGIYKGKEQEMEVYVYYLNATLLSTRTIEMKGNISLIR